MKTTKNLGRIENSTGYSPSELRAIARYTARYWSGRLWHRSFVFHYNNDRIHDRAVSLSWEGKMGIMKIRMPRGYCPVRELGKIIYGCLTGAWPPVDGQYYDEIEAKFGLVLLDNPYARRLERRRKRTKR